MTAEAPLAVRSWRVSRRTCTLTVPRVPPGQALQAVLEWSPDKPARLAGADLAQYRAGRNAALKEIARELGINVAVVDL